MKKTLFEFYEELSSLNFDKRKAQGLVKRANSVGYDIYYAYHEDGPDTWRNGWSSNDYKKDSDDVTLFEATNLIGKKKPTGSFQKAATYTAECVIFIFCPLQTLLADPFLRERKVNDVKKGAERSAISNYERATADKEKNSKWQQLLDENKAEIKRLTEEIAAIFGQPGSRKTREEKEKRIQELGGTFRPLSAWEEEAISFTLQEYIKFKQEKAVHNLLKNETRVN